MYKYFLLGICFIAVGCKKIEESAASARAYENAMAKRGQDKKGKILLRLNVPEGFKQQLTYYFNNNGGDGKGGENTDEICIFDFTAKPVRLRDTMNFVFSGRLKKVEYHVKMDGQTEWYDSSSAINTGTSASVAETFHSYVDKEFSIVADERNRILKGLEYSDKSYKPNNQLLEFNFCFIPFPEEEVGVGTVWSRDYISPYGFQLQLTYTIKNITPDTVTITVSSISNEDIYIGRSGEKGDYIIDRKTGLLLHGKLKGKYITLEFTAKNK